MCGSVHRTDGRADGLYIETAEYLYVRLSVHCGTKYEFKMLVETLICRLCCAVLELHQTIEVSVCVNNPPCPGAQFNTFSNIAELNTRLLKWIR